jgi:hypothetical protein
MKLKGHFKKLSILQGYVKKQIPRKAKKNFLSDKEFLAIYDLYKSLQTKEDWIFFSNVIETCKPYKHYKKSLLVSHINNYERITVEDYFNRIKSMPSIGTTSMYMRVLMEWLFTRTIHTRSMEVVGFSM